MAQEPAPSLRLRFWRADTALEWLVLPRARMEEEEETLARLGALVPGRETVLRTLLQLFGQPEHYSYPSIFIYGNTSTGKTHVMQTLLRELQLPHAWVSCVECVSPRLLFEHVLDQLVGLCPDRANSAHQRCDNLSIFTRAFRAAATAAQHRLRGRTVYVVLDKAEYVRDMDSALLGAFLRLQELTECNVTVVLLSELVWENFRGDTGFYEPITLHFPVYTKGELQQILCRDQPSEVTSDLYTTYVNILLGVFHTVCRDLRELKHLAALNFQKFCEPLQKGEATATDVHKLWRNIEPHLKKAMQTVHLREVSSAQWEKIQQQQEDATQIKGPSAHAQVELPFYSKFLLIAAYLASYNPARTDRRFFVKFSEKKKKTFVRREKTSNHLIGPKAFPLDRMMAIFYSIVDGRVAPTASIFSQISSLVSLQLLTLVSHSDQIDSPKYKCTASLDFIRAIARTVNFDVVRYLFDFV